MKEVLLTRNELKINIIFIQQKITFAVPVVATIFIIIFYNSSFER